MYTYKRPNPCPKCGVSDTKDKWEPAVTVHGGIAMEERIVRTCLNCGYIWSEAPIHPEKTS